MDIVIFGAGEVGRHVLKGLRSIDIRPRCFAEDNVDDSSRVEVDGLEIVQTKKAIQYCPDHLFVVALFQPSRVVTRLLEMGVEVCTFTQLALKYPGIFLPFLCMDARPPKLTAGEFAGLNLWADHESKLEYVSQLFWRRSFAHPLPPFRDIKDIYFPPDLVTLRQDEVFVDCGAYVGDTLNEYWARGGIEAIAIEPDPRNYTELIRSDNNPAHTFRACQFALGSKPGKVKFETGQGVSSSVGGDGTAICETLDNLLATINPTYIKMDIEGAELDALHGAKKTIRKHRPVLAICLYHRPADLWEIPIYIKSLVPDYKLYLRRYAEDCWEEVLYCVPPERAKK